MISDKEQMKEKIKEALLFFQKDKTILELINQLRTSAGLNAVIEVLVEKRICTQKEIEEKVERISKDFLEVNLAANKEINEALQEEGNEKADYFG